MFQKFGIVLLLAILPLQFSCTPDEDTTSNEVISEETKEVNLFIKTYMDFVYLWRNDMPKLNPNIQPDPKEYFDLLLNKTYDHWSFITEDYQGLMASLSGIEKSMGYSFYLYRLNNNDNKIFGLVEYVDPDGPADRANISRGDVIYKINGQELTLENYYSLLTLDSYILTRGSIDADHQITALSPTVNLTAVELNINPIHAHEIFELNGSKIGYLVYNSFIEEYENELEDVIAHFKSNNVTELVLDLRYNGGGYVSTAIKLASMIGPASIAGKTMIKSTYNDNLTNYYKTNVPDSLHLFETKFTSSPNNLNLSRLFVLTTEGTASASEMIIYTLKPYMEVVQIGKVTHGKYYASTVIQGPTDNDTWAIMPIYMRMENYGNTIDYTKGQVPRYEMYDDYGHELGDTAEELLAKALSVISGTTYVTTSDLKSAAIARSTTLPQAKSRLNPLKYNMYKDVSVR